MVTPNPTLEQHTNKIEALGPSLLINCEVTIDLKDISPSDLQEIFKQNVGHYKLSRTKVFGQYEYWDFTCRFGGRCRAKKNRTLKQYQCKSFIRLKVDHNLSKIILVEGNFIHSHPLSQDFYNSWLGPSKSTRNQIITYTKQGESAAYIRRKITESVSARKFYDIRRSYLNSREIDTIKTIQSIIHNLLEKYEIKLHMNKSNNQILEVTFISRMFKNKIIAKDILQIDDIMMTNDYDMPILNLLFIDENNNSQILGFSIMSSKEKEIFKFILDDVKSIIGTPRVVIIDRLKAQKAAIEEIMPNTTIVFCKVHMIRSIEQTFGPQSIIYKLFHKFIENQISRNYYIDSLNHAMMNSSKNKRAIQALIDEIDCYDPGTLLSLCLREQRTTNAIEGLNGNIRQRLEGKQDIETVINILDHLVYEFAWRSEKMLVEIDSNIYKGNVLGLVAVDKLKNEVEIAKKTKKQIMDGKANIELLKWINDRNCKCIAKIEYGLPCVHDIVNRLDKQNPLITENEIPEIYFKKLYQTQESNTFQNEIIEHEIHEVTHYDLSYSPLTRAFEEIASVVQRNDKVKELVVKLFNELKDIDLNLFSGRKRTRPANLIRRSGRKSQKRHYSCSICGRPGHNKATCPNLQKKNLGEKETFEEEEINENECIEMRKESSEDDFYEFDEKNTKVQINIDNGELLLNLTSEELKILESLSLEQLNLYQRYPIFHEFLLAIGRKKNPKDIETLNGIYYTQWKTVKEFVQNQCLDDYNEIGIIQLIYVMNYGQRLEDHDMLNHISQLTLYLETVPSDSFEID